MKKAKTIKARKALKKVAKRAKTKMKAVDQEWVEAEPSTLVAPMPVMPPDYGYYFGQESNRGFTGGGDLPSWVLPVGAGLLLGAVVVFFFIF